MVNIYQYDETEQSVAIVQKLLLSGSLNALAWGDSGALLICAQSVDQRLGRWVTRTSTDIGLAVFRNRHP